MGTSLLQAHGLSASPCGMALRTLLNNPLRDARESARRWPGVPWSQEGLQSGGSMAFKVISWWALEDLNL